jgi:hypothetical protein
MTKRFIELSLSRIVHLSYIVTETNGNPYVELVYPSHELCLSAEEISFQLLARMQIVAAPYLGQTVTPVIGKVAAYVDGS